MTERVWIVMRGNYSDMHPVAVFALRDAAEEFAKQFDGLGYGDDAWIWTGLNNEPVEFPVLTAAPEPVASWSMYVLLKETGEMRGEPVKSLEFADGAYVQPHPSLSVRVLDWATDDAGRRFRHIHGYGPDRDELVAAVNAEVEKIMATLVPASSD